MTRSITALSLRTDCFRNNKSSAKLNRKMNPAVLRCVFLFRQIRAFRREQKSPESQQPRSTGFLRCGRNCNRCHRFYATDFSAGNGEKQCSEMVAFFARKNQKSPYSGIIRGKGRGEGAGDKYISKMCNAPHKNVWAICLVCG